jgi:hypothetical protein
MGLIHGGDDIAKIIQADDEAARKGYVHAQDRHIERLRAELAAERTARLAAESLTARYAGLIGEQKEQLRVAATVDGIAQLVRKLKPQDITPESLGFLLLALSGRVDAMVKECGWSEFDFMPHELDLMSAHCQDTHDELHAVDVIEEPEPRGPRREGQEL